MVPNDMTKRTRILCTAAKKAPSTASGIGDLVLRCAGKSAYLLRDPQNGAYYSRDQQ